MSVRATWLGHSTVTLDVDGVRLLTDPLLRRHAGPLRRRGPVPDPAHWSGAHAVLLSHLHHDHAELSSLRMLPGIPVLTAPENARWLRRRGVAAAVGLAPDEWFDVGPVQVRLVRADHHHRPMPHRPNAANGHLVRAPSARIWVAGDTSLYPEMTELPQQAQGPLDLAVIPVGGWGPRLSAGHLDPAQAARACALAAVRHALPVHWGTLHPPLVAGDGDWLDRPGPQFAATLRNTAPACAALVVDPGAGVTLTERGTGRWGRGTG